MKSTLNILGVSKFSHVGIKSTRGKKVQSLVENDSNSWNMEKVKSIFNPHIAVEILKINLETI